MNLNDHNQRRDFLALKIKAGLPLTPEEQAEFDRLKGVRMVMTTGNILIVERPPETPQEWEARRAARNLRYRQQSEENERNNGQS